MLQVGSLSVSDSFCSEYLVIFQKKGKPKRNKGLHFHRLKFSVLLLNVTIVFMLILLEIKVEELLYLSKKFYYILINNRKCGKKKIVVLEGEQVSLF